MSDPTSLSIAEASAAITTGELTSMELTEAYLARIERVDPLLNSYITVTAMRALRDASRADAAIAAGNRIGPLHGIPVALKDIIDTGGILTTSGSKIRGEYIPVVDSPVAARLAAAGSVLLGKLNTHEFALGGTNINPHFGAAHNPWDPSRITGGSSGGSGAATAASLAAGTLGTDTGGSVRIPAALCGCVGLKPTFGRVSKVGVWPISAIYDHVGPMTRTVEDNALMLGAIAGYEAVDPYSVRTPVPDYMATLKDGVKGLRIGVPGGIFADGPVSEVKAAVEAALDVLRSLGAEIVESSLAVTVEETAGMSALIAEARHVHRKHIEERITHFGEDIQEMFAIGAEEVDAMMVFDGLRAGDALRARFQVALEEVDLLITATTPTPAMPIDAESIEIEGRTFDRMSVASLTAPMDIAQVPALTLPCGFSAEGLPIGLSLTGKPFDEALVLQAAWAYESATDWHRTAPPELAMSVD